MKAGELLTNEFITEQLTLGYTLPELAKMWDINYTRLCHNLTIDKKKFNYFDDKLKITGKREPYYQNEMEYGKRRTYKFSELSENEKEFYKESLKYK